MDELTDCPISVVCLQVLRYLLPASGVPEQNDTHASGSDDWRLLGYSHIHLFPAHHAGLEQHWHRPPGEYCSVHVFVNNRGNSLRSLGWCFMQMKPNIFYISTGYESL